MKLLVAFLALVIACSAADVAGKWNVVAPGRDGADMKLTMVLRQEAGAYTGYIATPDGEAALSDVQLKESELSFKVLTDEATYLVVGTVEGNTIKGKYKVNGQEAGTFTATRDSSTTSR